MSTTVHEFAMRRRFRRVILAVLVGLNFVGAAVSILLLIFVIPLPLETLSPAAIWGTSVLLFGYAVLATVVGGVMGLRILAPVERWVVRGGVADDETQHCVLDAPLMFTRRAAVLWTGGALMGAVYMGSFDLLFGITIGFVFGLAGLFVSTMTFLVSERVLRPLASRALRERPPSQRPGQALSKRLVFTWALSSGSGLLGLALVSFLALARPSVTTLRDLAATTLVLVALVLVSGLLATLLVARATAEPVEDLTDSLKLVQAGRLDCRVRVWDASELGVLQAGFNAMLSGLQERERIRDLFGRQVGEDVASAAVLGDVSFDGELRDVAVLFVDLSDSTALAENVEPSELIGLLNAFFDIVIDVVHEHEGWINKFQGDAAMAVWGAPFQVNDQATKSLAAARTMGARLRDELSGLTAGIGVSGGTVVAGNVGGSRRYEYTAIGDPVNEAARLTESAKSRSKGVVANADLLDHAAPQEQVRWVEVEAVVVRGRSLPTRIAVPTS